jgi:hypothetical protein
VHGDIDIPKTLDMEGLGERIVLGLQYNPLKLISFHLRMTRYYLGIMIELLIKTSMLLYAYIMMLVSSSRTQSHPISSASYNNNLQLDFFPFSRALSRRRLCSANLRRTERDPRSVGNHDGPLDRESARSDVRIRSDPPHDDADKKLLPSTGRNAIHYLNLVSFSKLFNIARRSFVVLTRSGLPSPSRS